ncbi:hypothetical protein ACH4OX_24370 [Streptomyces roseolus]|uniref:hypothetical protein n=1 Tax=Streptomyces roseolus TaxID=67358 RepID=UPI003794290F
MTTHPTLRVAHLTQLADSPAEAPVLYLNEDDDLDVWAAALVPHDRVVLTQEQLVDSFGGAPDTEDNRLDVYEVVKDEVNQDIARILDGE